MDVEVDRLSSLPDCLIYKILSYVDIVYSIRLSVLSSRWRFVWTSMHEILNTVLSSRNNTIGVSSVSVDMLAICGTHQSPVKRILEYAFSHNVQKLTIGWRVDPHQLHPSLFNSKSLKHLTIFSNTIDCRSYSPWNLPALTTLHIHHVRLDNCSSNLAMCQNLKNLTVERCEVFERKSSDGFTIKNSLVLDLTLKNVLSCELNYLRIKGSCIPKISLDGSPEKVDLRVSSPHKTDVHKICDLFQCLHSVKSLVLSLEIVELLSSSAQVISNQPSPFVSLKSLKISPFIKGFKHYPYIQEQAATEITLSTEVKNYLLDRSPNAAFTVVSHKEDSAIKVTRKVHHLMERLQKYLQETEADIESNKTDRMMSHVDSSGRNFELAEINPRGHPGFILQTLHEIKELLTKVLTSKRVVMQAYFSRLRAEAQSVVNKIIVDMKNRWDIEQSIFNGYFNEFNLSS